MLTEQRSAHLFRVHGILLLASFLLGLLDLLVDARLARQLQRVQLCHLPFILLRCPLLRRFDGRCLLPLRLHSLSDLACTFSPFLEVSLLPPVTAEVVLAAAVRL